MTSHQYAVTVDWAGNHGAGTRSYTAYGREHVISVAGKPSIEGSSDPAYRGDASRHNPEDLLVASLSACHMLWYLHLCSANGIVVTHYRDAAMGVLTLEPDGSGAFSNVTLTPDVVLDARHDAHELQRALALHETAHNMCFIAKSMAFEVAVKPSVRQTNC